MILVDSSVWIDHFRHGDLELVEQLGRDVIGTHPLVIEELALGSLAERSTTLELLANLYGFPWVAHEELMALIESRVLWSRGLGAVDAQLLGSVLVVPGAALWTRDKRLRRAAADAGVLWDE